MPDLSLCGQVPKSCPGSHRGLLFRPPAGAGRPMPWELMRLSCLQTSLTAPSTNDRRPPGEAEKKEGGSEAQGLEKELVLQETVIHPLIRSFIYPFTSLSDHPIICPSIHHPSSIHPPSMHTSVCLANCLLTQASFHSLPIFYPFINLLAK